MNLLLSPKEYEELQESCKQFEKDLDDVLTEGITDIISSPIKYIKLKNNSKKYQKILVKKALNDVDYAKRKEKGKDDLDAKQKEVLTQANKAKNQALSDKASAISGRMSDLATTDILKSVEKLAKSKAKIAAAETTLKAASGEELKKLKIKIADWKGDAKNAEQALKDYEKEGGDEAEDTGGGEKVDKLKKSKEKVEKTLGKMEKSKGELQDKMDDATGDKRDELEKQMETIDSNIESNKKRIEDLKAEIAKEEGKKPPETTEEDEPKGGKKEPVETEEDEPKGKEAAQKKVDDIKKKIEDVTNLIDKQKEKDPDKDLSQYTDLLGKRQGELEDAESELKKAGETKDESNTEAFYLKMNETLDNIERGIDDIKKEIYFPTFKVNESVKDKFARLLNEKRSV
jgi:hypothetical protein